MHIIGIDCATIDTRIGLVLARNEAERIVILAAEIASPARPAVETICAWLESARPALLALDAPLGWPAEMGPSLIGHQPGAPLPISANRMFRRRTDRFIQETIGRRPLDVGADRIARTAHAALALLERVRTKTGLAIPLSWEPQDIQKAAAIEVYPAGTLQAGGMQASGYKKAGDVEARRALLARLGREMDLGAHRPALLANADALDAAVCALAGGDYLAGRALPPTKDVDVRKEGWIWVREPAPGG